MAERINIISQALRKGARGIIRFYQLAISPYLPATCRYLPTCSQYGLEALERFGFFQGSWFTFKRILRCHPWARGGYDPVPPKK